MKLRHESTTIQNFESFDTPLTSDGLSSILGGSNLLSLEPETSNFETGAADLWREASGAAFHTYFGPQAPELYTLTTSARANPLSLT